MLEIWDLIPGSERSPREGNSNSLWYSCLGNPMAQSCKGLDTTQRLTHSHTLGSEFGFISPCSIL